MQGLRGDGEGLDLEHWGGIGQFRAGAGLDLILIFQRCVCQQGG